MRIPKPPTWGRQLIFVGGVAGGALDRILWTPLKGGEGKKTRRMKG